MLTSSSFSFFTHHSFCYLFLFLWEVLVHSCIRFGWSALVSVIRWQMMVVVMVGVMVNGGGMFNFLCNFDLTLYGFVIHIKHTDWPSVIRITYGLTIRIKLTHGLSIRKKIFWNLFLFFFNIISFIIYNMFKYV